MFLSVNHCFYCSSAISSISSIKEKIFLPLEENFSDGFILHREEGEFVNGALKNGTITDAVEGGLRIKIGVTY